MLKIISLLLLPFLLISEELEVKLSTRSNLKPIYLSSFKEEFRSILEFDLNTNGFTTVVSPKEHLESRLQNPFDVNDWKKEKIPYCIQAEVKDQKLEITLYNIEKKASKKYPAVPLDRKYIHKLADTIQKDLFGIEGIASQRIIYTERTKTGTEKGHYYFSEVWIADSDGASSRQITNEHAYCLSPSFFENNKEQFVYVSEKNGQSKIYKGSFISGKCEPIIDLRGSQALPALSKKADQITFITDVAGRPDLFIQRLDEKGHGIGKARQLFSAPRATQATSTFSPDGKQLAFVSDKDGPPRIYLLNLQKESARPHLITKKNRENTSPAWSPDGTKLAYSAKVDGIRQIWIYDFLKNEEIPLTTGAENKENPSWAPDSLHLVYNTETNDISELFLINLNEPNPVQITKGAGQKRFASWEPR